MRIYASRLSLSGDVMSIIVLMITTARLQSDIFFKYFQSVKSEMLLSLMHSLHNSHSSGKYFRCGASKFEIVLLFL